MSDLRCECGLRFHLVDDTEPDAVVCHLCGAGGPFLGLWGRTAPETTPVPPSSVRGAPAPFYGPLRRP